MSFFDPGNLFGGGGPGRDPLGIFSRGGGPMSQQQLMMQRTMGPNRFNTVAQGFGGASRGGAEGSPPEMGAVAPPQTGGWGTGALGGMGLQSQSKPLDLGGGGQRQAMNASFGAKLPQGWSGPSFGSGPPNPRDLAQALRLRGRGPGG